MTATHTPTTAPAAVRPQDERTLTELDHVRIERWLERHAQAHDALQDLIDGATVVPGREVLPHVVTLYTRVRLRELPGGEERVYTLCWPEDAEPANGFVSVLSPVGSALLGRHVGAIASWHTPDGAQVRAEITAILFQPESTGDYTL